MLVRTYKICRLGVNTPLFGLQGNATAEKAYASGLSKAEQQALASMTSEQLAEFKQFGDRASQDRSFMNVIASDAREAQDLASRLSSTATRSERADASLAERSAFAERVSTAYERGETISIDIAQDPHNLAHVHPLRRAVRRQQRLRARADGSGTGPTIPAPA